MKKRFLFLTFFFLAVFHPQFAFSQKAVESQPSFETFWTQFKSLIEKGDKKAVVLQVQFPVTDWEDRAIGAIPTPQKFLEKYDLIFYPEFQKKILEGKPWKDGYGNYLLTWKGKGRDQNNEYSLVFVPVVGGYRLSGCYVGPAY